MKKIISLFLLLPLSIVAQIPPYYSPINFNTTGNNLKQLKTTTNHVNNRNPHNKSTLYIQSARHVGCLKTSRLKPGQHHQRIPNLRLGRYRPNIRKRQNPKQRILLPHILMRWPLGTRTRISPITRNTQPWLRICRCRCTPPASNRLLTKQHP